MIPCFGYVWCSNHDHHLNLMSCGPSGTKDFCLLYLKFYKSAEDAYVDHVMLELLSKNRIGQLVTHYCDTLQLLF